MEDLSRGGAGVGRLSDGKAIFVPLTAPGDRALVRVVREDKRYAEGELVRLLEPSAFRQSPPCLVFGRCGGCEWQHLPYSLQWDRKVNGVRHALARTSVEAKAGFELYPAERIWEYRNRIQLRGEKDRLGFFARRSHDIVPIERCEIARPEINSVIAEVREEGRLRPGRYKVEIEVLPDGKIRRVWNARHGAKGFRQVHDDQNRVLQRVVASFLTTHSERRTLLDLYGGQGNLSLGLSGSMKSVHCVDLSSPNGRRADQPTNYHFHRSGVVPWLRRDRVFDGNLSIVLDPPREGLGADFRPIVGRIEAWGADEVVAVGCDPDSWARDLSRFLKRGWRLERLAVIDLFPQTHHVESIALLRRGGFGVDGEQSG